MKFRFVKLTALCLLVALMSVTATSAMAASKPRLPKLTLYALEGSLSYDLVDAPDGIKILSVKSSKPDVLKAENTQYPGNFSLEPLKPGKSKVTVTYRASGKTASVSATYTVKKFPKVFATLKVNGQKVQPIPGCNNRYQFENYKKNSATITFKVKKGWKVVQSVFGLDGESLHDFKSGQRHKMPKKSGAQAWISVIESKTRKNLIFWFTFRR